LALAGAALSATAEGRALAANPTTADCLSASEASLKLGEEHKLRAERAQLLVCAASSCPSDIRKECLARVERVSAQVPSIVFTVKDASGGDVSAVKVAMDGETLSERLEGTAVAIDPGEHTFTFEAPGHPAVTKKLVIVQGQKDRSERVVFGDLPPAPAARVDVPAPGPAPRPAESGGGLGAQKVLALVAGGIGIAGLGVGAAFGVMALSKKSDAQSVCPDQCATADGVNKWSDATSTGNISTIALIAGGAVVAGAAVLWLTAPSSVGAASTRVGLGPGGVQMRGVW
jgi:hypothetical protein